MPSSGLRAAALAAIEWNFIGQAGRQVVSFLVSIVLARLVAPSEFGLLAMLYVFQEAANALIGAGLNAPLIQAEEVTQEDTSTVFYFNVAAGLLCYLALAAGAPAIAGFYQQPQLVPVVYLYGLAFLIHGFGNVHAALLLRELDYRRVNLIALAGIVSSGVVAIVLALRGYGVYSLLGQHITYACVSTGLYWLSSSWRPARGFSRSSFRRMFGFGSQILVVSFLDKVLATLDDLIIGRLQGTAFLGQYSRGKTTRNLPITHINSVISAIVFPLFSRIGDRDHLREVHDRFIGTVSYVTAPTMVGLLLLAEPFLVVVYSDVWLPAAPFLRVFCIFGLTVPLNSVLVQTVMSSGRLEFFLRVELVKKALLFTSIGLGATLGPMGLLWALCIGSYLALLISFVVVARLLDTSAASLIGSALPGVGLALAMAVPVYLVRELVGPNPLWALLLPTAAGVVSYWALSALLGSRDYRFARGLLLERLGRSRQGVSQ